MSTNKKDSENRYRNNMSSVDEGWWESVLADESKYISHHLKLDDGGFTQATEAAGHSDMVQPDWDLVKQYFKDDRIIELKVTGQNRGGLLVEGEGLSGFVPCSHLIDLAGMEAGDERAVDLGKYIGKTLKVKVIECQPDEERIVFSERAALSEPGRRVELFESLEPGVMVSGKVTNITDFGVFIDLGGVEGLIHISELSWGRVSHPRQLVQMGDDIQVQVLDVSPERCRVALSRKRLLPNPWENAVREFPEGTVVSATISNVLSYGAFANLDFGVEGLIHASEMNLEAGQSPRDILTQGQRVDLRVIHLDADHQRLGFSMKLDDK